MDGHKIIKDLEIGAAFAIANDSRRVLSVLVDDLNEQMDSAKDANQNLQRAQDKLSDAHDGVDRAIEKLLQARVTLAEAEVDFVSACNQARRAIARIDFHTTPPSER